MVSLVVLQNGVSGKLFLAHVTSKRFNAQVRTNVAVQQALVSEFFITMLTWQEELLVVGVLSTDMVIQILDIEETLAAIIANVRGIWHMLPTDVSAKLIFDTKVGMAMFAGVEDILGIANMNLYVVVECLFGFMGLAAHKTAEEVKWVVGFNMGPKRLAVNKPTLTIQTWSC